MSDNQAGEGAAIPSGDALNPTPPRKRGRPAGSNSTTPKVEKKPETPHQRIERLKAELQQAEAEKAALEQQMDSIVGRVVRAHALAHADYRKELAELLRREITSKGELAIIGELLH